MLTVFLFPPRKVNGRGPMIWNSQILQFAGYETEGSSILGDPASVELTKAIVALQQCSSLKASIAIFGEMSALTCRFCAREITL